MSTIIRILEKKQFIGYEAFGKSHRYYPLIAKDEYCKSSVNKLVTNYFEGSFERMVSFFAKEQNLSVKELDELTKAIDQLKKEDLCYLISL